MDTRRLRAAAQRAETIRCEEIVKNAHDENWDSVFTELNSVELGSVADPKRLAGALLHEAILQNNLIIFRRLLEKNPALEVEKDFKLPIELAAELERYEFIDEIVKVATTDENKKARNFSAKSGYQRYGRTLYNAAKKNQTKLALAAIKIGASLTLTNFDEDYIGENAIHQAIHNNNVDLLEAILEKNHTVLNSLKDEVTPLQLALTLNQPKSIQLLLTHGEDPSTAYDAAVQAARNGKWDGVFAYLNNITNPKLAGALLHEAITQKKISIAQQLLAKDPLLNVEKDGETPAQSARRLGCLDIANEIEKCEKIKAILQLKKDLTNQIRVLDSEIAANTKTPAFFKKISEGSNGSTKTKKEEKRNVLSAALELINDQITTDAFRSVLNNNPHWKDGIISKRTEQLIERTVKLVGTTSAKESERPTS